MIKTLSYFFVAVLLVGGTKLIEVMFYDVLKSPHPGDKVYKGKEMPKSPAKDPLDEVKESVRGEIDTDSLIMNFEDSVEEVQANEQVDFETESAPDQEDIPNEELQADSNSLTGDDYFQDLKNSYLSPILASLPEGRSREDVVIRYFKHEKDDNKVYALRRLGYYVHERKAEDNEDLPSNSLYYGSDVDIRDIKLVAYTLIKAGVSLKAIKQSAYDWKFNAIEIGADSLIESNPILSITDVETFEIR